MFTFPRRCEGPESGRADAETGTDRRETETLRAGGAVGPCGGGWGAGEAGDPEQDKTQVETENDSRGKKEGGSSGGAPKEKWENAERSSPRPPRHPAILKSRITNSAPGVSRRCAGWAGCASAGFPWSLAGPPGLASMPLVPGPAAGRARALGGPQRPSWRRQGLGTADGALVHGRSGSPRGPTAELGPAGTQFHHLYNGKQMPGPPVP